MSLNYKEINANIAKNIESILKNLSVSFRKDHNRVILSCPIHNSSSQSLNIYTSGERNVGNFVCWTKNCHENGSSSLFVIKALLERSGNKVSIEETLKFLDSNFQIKATEQVEEDDFTYLADTSARKVSGTLSREMIRSYLKIPATYYLNRGFKQETLDYFDVGTCHMKNFEMRGRIVVPVYDYESRLFIGCVGRTLQNQCKICELYHPKNFPCPSDKQNIRIFHKWINSKNFRTGQHLYNLWNALPHIQSTGKVVLVEGQGDVWKLYEAGIYNCVGLFTNKISREQMNLLNSTGVMNIYLALDNDEGGETGTASIEKKLQNYYNINRVSYPGKDIGEADIETLRRIFKCVY